MDYTGQNSARLEDSFHLVSSHRHHGAPEGGFVGTLTTSTHLALHRE
jgi:hypothetical protein